MKPKIYFKLTFSKAILLTVVVCAFYIARHLPERKHSIRKSTPATIAAAPVVVQPTQPQSQTQLQSESKLQTETIAVEASKEIKAPEVIVETPKEVVVLPKKKFTLQKRVQKVTKSRQKEAALTKLVEDELAIFDESKDALDIHGPLDILISQGFDERSSESEYRLASTRDNQKTPEKLPEEEQPYLAVEGTLQKNDYEELKKALDQIKQLSDDIETQINQPQASPATTTAEKNILVKPPLTASTAFSKKAETQDSVKLKSETETTQSAPQEQETDTKSKEPDDESRAEEPTLATPTHKKYNLSPVEASMMPELTGKQFIAPGRRLSTNKVDSQYKVTTQSIQDPQTETTNGEKLYGTLYMDEELDVWLTANKGHIELSLHRVASKNPEDTIKIYDYVYPEREFSHDTSKFEGKYVLVANIYSPKDKTPFLQITYPKTLSPANFGEKVVFDLKMQKGKIPLNEAPVLNVTVFEAAGGNYRQAKPVMNAILRVVGIESLGSFKTDKEGNVRIQGVPLQSELLLDVSAEGFYPTRKTVPITGVSAYATVSLVEKQKVETITGYFTRKPQAQEKSVIFGRLFDPNSRKPLSDDEVLLSNRKGHALYFNALPNTSLTRSTSTGLFAFLNVEPAFRIISREKSEHVLPVQLLPGYGYYADFGRGGKKSLKAIVTDPIQNQIVFGSAKTIGSKDYQADSAENGKFEIKDIDLPSGNVTVEFRAKDYPVTWYTFPWDTRDASRTQKLYILEKELIYESAVSFARIKPEKHKGILVGGADANFFSGNSCVKVELLDQNGKQQDEEKGPYLLFDKSYSKDKPCLTKEKSGFAFYNLDAGEYVLKWQNKTGKLLATQVVRVGSDRLSIVVR